MGLIPAHAGKTLVYWAAHQMGRAHPRSRGENGSSSGDRRAAQGSSPLTRGKHDAQACPPGPQRLIPAHAGKTGSCFRLASRPWAHPRSRGENRTFKTRPVGMVGSSPLTRGKLECDAHYLRRSGLIPAHAGKTMQTNGSF